jgi:phosphoadenosine phosphosulfate reductase
MATQVLPRIRIVFVDTGYLFPETHQFMEELRQRSTSTSGPIGPQRPDRLPRQAGEDEPMLRKNVDACCGANKNEPFERAMEQLKPKAWLRGIRRQQATRRGEADRRMVPPLRLLRRLPLLTWTQRDIHAYMKSTTSPTTPLRKGYASIGCNPLTCTRPIQIGEDPRAGRWAGTRKIECGLHLEGDGAGI